MGDGLHACFQASATSDLYSVIWEGWLRRLAQKDEQLLADYLGPGGHEFYTTRETVKTLREMYGISTFNNDDTADLLFSSHWSGVCGILPGSDCGDQPQDAFHAPWHRHLQVLGDSAECTQVLATMQQFYSTWDEQCNWTAERPLQLLLFAVNEPFLMGDLLARPGRSTAFELWAVRADNHIVVDVSDSLQVVAMGRTSREKLCPDDARAAVRMLTLGDTALQEEVVRVRILTDMESESGVLVRQCTSLSQVIRFFQKMCFVWVRPAHYPPLPTFTDPLCSFACFCRYAGCEHVEFTKMLDLRLRQATSSAEQLPVQRKRGRKRGRTLTARGESEARRARVKQAPTATSSA
jgi:hypothetical protein